MKNLKNKSVGVIFGYMIIYLAAFFWLEQTPVRHNVIRCSLDNLIPFRAEFIVPYVMWYFFVAGTVLYFLIGNESPSEYGRLVGTLATGMTIFLIISFVWPNRHYLRVEPVGDGIFNEAVRLLHQIDTSTNVFPSIHVFNTVACYLAIRNNESCRKNRLVMGGTGILTVAIVLSTMFLKQHSVVDVVGALVFNWVCYGVFYKWIPENRKVIAAVLNREQVLTIPNFLSLIRLGLAIMFWGIGQRMHLPERQIWLVGILALSAVTDFLDGKIARKYGMISEFGKILDPIADKVTQGVIMLHLLSKYRLLELVLILFFVKELTMAFYGAKTVVSTRKDEGAQWCGKINTAVFYAVMLILVLFPGIPKQTANMLIMISAVFMAGAFIMFMRYYRELLAEHGDRSEHC